MINQRIMNYFDSYQRLRRSREISSSFTTNNHFHQSTNQLSSSISSQDALNMITCNCVGTNHNDGGDDDNLKVTNQPRLKPLTLSGIKNHGNTCFMNAILQCLSHTDLMVEYFNTLSYYLEDIKTRLKLNVNSTNNGLFKNGSNSEVATQCASLFQSLWRNDYSPDISSKFKSLIGKYCKQYEDGGQHDAQEFLFFLLDILHEDLNVAIKKKTNKKKTKKLKIPSTWNRSDEVIAAETLSIYTRCDNSFIRKVFQAQLRSSVVCRSCKSHSNTFDPYMCLSLPVPAKLIQISIINVSYLDKVPEKIRMAVTIEAQATMKEMRHKVSRLIKIPETRLVLLINDGSNVIKESHQFKSPISEFLNDTDEIEAIETPRIDETINDKIIDSSPKKETQQLTLVWTNSVGSKGNKFFGPYFSCLVNRDASFKDIQSELVQAMQPILKLDSVKLECIKELPLFKLKVVRGIQGRCYLPEHGDHPLYSSTVNEALSHCKTKDYRGPTYVMLIVEWDIDLKQSLIVDSDKVLIITEDPNMKWVIARNRMSNQATLEDCFDMYFREERLGADDAWMCPSCKKKQQCIKKLSLWSTPDILIIHLKRFRQAANLQRTKLSTLVNFPFNGLDLNPYLSKRKQHSGADDDCNGSDSLDYHSRHSNNHVNSYNLSYILYPWKKPREKEIQSHFSADNVYDLYAVCNHHGSMSSGHYTAYCRDINDQKWYSFDDQQVSKLSESSIVTEDAYILFYQRTTIPPFSLIPPPGKPPTTPTPVKTQPKPSSIGSSSTTSLSSSSSSSSSDSDQSSIASSTSVSNTSLNSDNQPSPVKDTK